MTETRNTTEERDNQEILEVNIWAAFDAHYQYEDQTEEEFEAWDAMTDADRLRDYARYLLKHADRLTKSEDEAVPTDGESSPLPTD